MLRTATAGKYVGNRPVKLRASTWKDRDAGVVKKKEKNKMATLGASSAKLLCVPSDTLAHLSP